MDGSIVAAMKGASSPAWLARSRAAAEGTLAALAELVNPGAPPVEEAAAAGWSPEPLSAACWRCGASVAAEAVTLQGCPYCLNTRPPWDRIIRLGPYGPPLSDWVQRMKFSRAWAWAIWAGEQLANRLAEPVDELTPLVCPVPLHWRRRWMRGFNQAELIGHALARRRGWPMCHLLQRLKPTLAQTSLPVSARRDNVSGAFIAAPVDLSDHEVWLIDDVKTTGSTLRSCARLLRNRGAGRIHVAVMAVADPRNQAFEAI